MAKVHRVSMIAVVIACFVGAQGNAIVFASEDTELQPSTSDVLALTPQTQSSRLKLDTEFLEANAWLVQGTHSTQATALAGQIYQGRPYRVGRNGSIAAIMIGAVATITGAAILVYANRPDCEINQFAGGCGYGTKVIGGSVLAGGVVGLFVGALTWK
jgi:hypothetical protein